MIWHFAFSFLGPLVGLSIHYNMLWCQPSLLTEGSFVACGLEEQVGDLELRGGAAYIAPSIKNIESRWNFFVAAGAEVMTGVRFEWTHISNSSSSGQGRDFLGLSVEF